MSTAIFGGLLVATVMNFLVTPALYVIIKSLVETVFSGKHPDEHPKAGEPIESVSSPTPHPEANAFSAPSTPYFEGINPT